MAFMNLKILVLEKKGVLINFALSFFSTCFLFSVMKSRYTTFWRLRKARLNIFWGAKYGFKALTAFSCKFQLIFLLSLFVVLFRS